MSTAPKELREVDMNAKMSKSKKKKLKKRAKRNQQLMDQTMQHIVEVEKNELLEKSGGSDQLEKDAAAEDEDSVLSERMMQPSKARPARTYSRPW